MEQYKEQINQIFTQENLPVILAVINHIRPKYLGLCRDTEFSTIVNVAKLDGIQELVAELIQYVENQKRIHN